MLNPNDYKCTTRGNIFICAANTHQALAIYQVLQDRLRIVASTMAAYRNDVPKSLSTLTSDGRVGPTTALAAQVVLAALGQLVPLPADLQPILSAQARGDEIITLVAQQADVILSYIDTTLTQYPNIMRPQQQMQTVPPAKKPKFPVAGWIAFGSGLLTVGGLVLVARSSQKASSGKEDRSAFLPEPTIEEQEADRREMERMEREATEEEAAEREGGKADEDAEQEDQEP